MHEWRLDDTPLPGLIVSRRKLLKYAGPFSRNTYSFRQLLLLGDSHRRRLHRGNRQRRPGTHARTGANVAFCPGTFHGRALIFKWTLQLYLLNLPKGAKFAGSVGHPMTKMLSASGGFAPCPWTPLGALLPDPHYRLGLRTRHGAPTTDPFRRL